ncbi:uncharacterized protein MELLADRAFT_105857 [Melampsora larici-populina 98AG31]|uniref:Uncharacterized protein n=1 Tax=Melampsora larici-populina (strain 98AG31 / pathotype 3-4-7) TaxID=747676 RepID=F4RJK0_MELLP|nr:uncharacterized protein MELLADRAFT_105857 [Melampsora larici-populina 98AG31]EGG07322.1 hypothetical protein MELLADRAFT_105857 [Melampsora larici-populina 98AG31]
MENVNPATGRYQVGWDMISNGDEQTTAVTGGRMLSHLAPSGRSQAQGMTGQFFGESSHHQNVSHHEFGELNGNGSFSQNGRGRGRRGRGVSRGINARGGGSRGGHSGPTTVVNGVTVPKFGPGAFEAVKAAKQAGTGGNGASAHFFVHRSEIALESNEHGEMERNAFPRMMFPRAKRPKPIRTGERNS